ncbi:tyrosine-type recombinase/integrase [Roseiconus lacunae]|uniref:Tyr recombinase domain-containing protein n=1 Tax=Roseiconus lacunae TaxID=2605694 RepID=A0ABT7PP01_9BACT|nr:hypothetical protein [Roseiconus lacunae]MDM4018239.1 hypothetical protein [Roseiconus lacunae]
MPRKLELTFQKGADGRSGRWRKKHNGKVYYLGTGRSKSDRDSYQKALAKWRELQEALDARRADEPKPYDAEYDELIQHWELVLSWSVQHDQEAEASNARNKLEELRERKSRNNQPPTDRSDVHPSQYQFDLELPPDIQAKIRRRSMALSESDATEVYDEITRRTPISEEDRIDLSSLNAVKEERVRWEDRLESQAVLMSRSECDSVSGWTQLYLELHRKRVEAGELSAGRYQKIQTCVDFFVAWYGKSTAVATIDGRTLARLHSHLLELVSKDACAPGYANDRLREVRSLIRWLWEQDAVEKLPKNIDSRGLRIARKASTPQTFTVFEIEKLVRTSNGRVRLWILLGLNCGMTQRDISELQDSQVDWLVGRITRKRSKTQKHESVPTVTYKLWPETHQLLKELRSGGERVLVNRNGQPLLQEYVDDNGKYKKNDNIRNAYNRLLTKADLTKSFKLLRKTSASLLDNHSTFRGLGELFLGHAPRTVAQRHYIQTTDTALDDAIDYLRSHLRISHAVAKLEETPAEE